MAGNDIFVPSIAARKAARKKTLNSGLEQDAGHTPGVVPTPTIEAPIAQPSAFSAAPVKAIEPVTEVIPTQAKVQVQTSETLSKEMLLKLAGQFGLKLQPEKKEFIKHTYSITPDRKEKMKAMSDSLGLNLQDAICEAFDLFFVKHSAEFEAVSKAKKGI